MLVGSRAKGVMAAISIVVTSLISVQYISLNQHNAYQVYMNGKPLAYVRNKEDFNNAKNEVEKDLEKRFGVFNIKDDITFEEVKTKSESIINERKIRDIIIDNSKTSILAVLMKSDNKRVGVLASENEMIKVLDIIKNEYKENDKNSVFRLNNKITYIKESTSIKELNSIEEVVKMARQDSKNPIISFSKEKETASVEKVSLSRAASTISFAKLPAKGSITSNFGMRWGKMHNGIDIGASMGEPIYAAMDGKVTCAEWEEGYGKVIKIEHGVGVQSIYGHCSDIEVSSGQVVKRGEKIGEVGSTGNSTGPHVHFEIRVDGVPQDPTTYLK